MTSLSNYSHVRPVLTASAYRRRHLGKRLHRKAIAHLLATVAVALLLCVVFRGPLAFGAGGLLFAVAGWRYLLSRRQIDFLKEAPITLHESLVSESRFPRNVYRVVMSYTFEGRTYSSPQKIALADYGSALSREISLYAVFDHRNPGKMLSYRAGSVIPRWLTTRSKEGVACERFTERPLFRQVRAEKREEIGVDQW